MTAAMFVPAHAAATTDISALGAFGEEGRI